MVGASDILMRHIDELSGTGSRIANRTTPESQARNRQNFRSENYLFRSNGAGRNSYSTVRSSSGKPNQGKWGSRTFREGVWEQSS